MRTRFHDFNYFSNFTASFFLSIFHHVAWINSRDLIAILKNRGSNFRRKLSYYLNSTPSSLTPGLASSFLALKLNPPSGSPSMLYWFRSTIIGSDFSWEATISSFSWCGSLASCSFLNWRISETTPVASTPTHTHTSCHDEIESRRGCIVVREKEKNLFYL